MQEKKYLVCKSNQQSDVMAWLTLEKKGKWEDEASKESILSILFLCLFDSSTPCHGQIAVGMYLGLFTSK